MEALSPSQIEDLLSSRLKRHEARLAEHRAALAGSKQWLVAKTQTQHAIVGAQENSTNTNNNHVAATVEDRFSAGFHPSQVLPTSLRSSASPSQQPVAAPSVLQHQQQPHSSGGAGTSSQQQHQQQLDVLDAGSLSHRQQQMHHPHQQRGASPRTGSSSKSLPQQQQQRRASSVGGAGAGAGAGGGGSRSRSGSAARNASASTNNFSGGGTAGVFAAAPLQLQLQQRAAVLAAAMKDREERASKTALKFGPVTGEAVGTDILTGDSIIDVAARSAVASFSHTPTISADSNILAKKLRAACGAQGKNVVESMEAIHAKATQQKWLRMQQIHEEQTRPFHSTTAHHRPQHQQHQSSSRTPARGGADVGAGVVSGTPRAGVSNGRQHLSISSTSVFGGVSVGDRLHEAATKHVKEEKFRQIVADAMQENTFTPTITQRARALRRHPGHSVGDDLYGMAHMKANRAALAAQLRDEMELATATQMGQPVIDSVSASIATSLMESSYERLTKPKSSRTRSSALHSSSSRGSSTHSSNEPTFAPEINRRSEILAHTSTMQHSPNTVRQRRDAKLQQLRQEVEQERMEECTFRPAINHNNNNNNVHDQQRGGGGGGGGGSFFTRNEAWMKKRDKHIEEMRKEKQQNELEECVFQPAQTNLGYGFSSGDAGPSTYHHQQLHQQPIYGGADRRAWGVDHHMDRMEAARIIENDRKERAAAGVPYSESHHRQQQQQNQNQCIAIPVAAQSFRDPTDNHLNVVGNRAAEHQGSVLSRAQEALARAVAVSADQQQHYHRAQY